MLSTGGLGLGKDLARSEQTRHGQSTLAYLTMVMTMVKYSSATAPTQPQGTPIRSVKAWSQPHLANRSRRFPT